MSWVTVLWPPGRYLSAEVSPRLRGSPGRGGNSGRPSRARQLEVEGPGSSRRPHNGPGGPVSTSNRRIRAPACLKHPGNNTRTADHTACSTPPQPRGHAARAISVAIVRIPPVVRMADGQSCRTVSTQSTPVSTQSTGEGPVWCAWPTGSPAALQPPCGATTHVPPMRGQVYSQYSIAPLNPQPPCRVEYSQRTACPQRRGRCGSAVQSAPEWRSNKQKHKPAPPWQVAPGC